jgi:glycine dehydrogenase subunit 2
MLRAVADEAHQDPELVRTAPHRSTIHRVDQSWFDDPELWAPTWRAYRRKHARAEDTPGGDG